jgi:LacI family transcriptional regulator
MRISQETRQRVLQAARQLDYHPDATARRMVSGRTRVIGFVLRQAPELLFADALLSQVLSGVSRAALAQGFRVLFEEVAAEDSSGSYITLVRERHADGIVLSGPRIEEHEVLRLLSAGSPIVLVGQLDDAGIPCVDVDNVGGARMAVNHLIELGHRRIGLITNGPPIYAASAARLAGYREALDRAGLPFEPQWVYHGDFTPASGQAAMQALLALSARPTAVFVASDAVAFGALNAIRQRGLRVPDDLALVGFDDIPLAEAVEPPLTTVRVPAAGLGWGAAELLMRLIAGDEDIRNPFLLLDAELIVRQSSGAGSVKG